MRILSSAWIALALVVASLALPTISMSQQKQMMVRIAEIEIEPEYLEQYRAILQRESSASVRLEPGVICIFPMFDTENPTQIRILEIYASRDAYESHLQSPHFQEYKTTTLKMVKSLRLVELSALDAATMAKLFRKMS